MSAAPDLPEVHRAVDQLIELAGAVRPDWFRNEIRDAIVGAATAGWTWPRVLVELVRLMADPQGSPRELVAAASNPLKHRAAPPPGTQQRGADMVRRVLAGGEAP